MYRELFRIPLPGTGVELPVYGYGFMLMVGFLVALYLLRRRAAEEGIPSSLVTDLATLLLVSGVLGARAAYLVEMHDEFSWRLFDLSDGGFAWMPAVVSSLFTAWLAWRRPGWEGMRGRWPVVVAAGVVAFVASGRLFYVVLHPDAYPDAFEFLKIYHGGLALYGGLIAATVSGVVFLRRRNVDVWRVADMAAPSVAAGLVFGRVGCFLNGCCFGKPTHCFLGVRFPGHGHGAPGPVWLHQLHEHMITFASPYTLPVHPTQLYHAFANLLVFLVVSAYYRRRRYAGDVFFLFCILHPLFRFPVEFLRDDMGRYAGLTPYQIVAIVWLVCIAAAWSVVRMRSVPLALGGVEAVDAETAAH